MLSKIKKFIPKTIKEKVKEKKWKLKYKRYIKKQEEKNKKGYILIGTPLHGNIGDQAIAIAEHKFLNDIGIKNIFEIPSPQVKNEIKYLKRYISSREIIMIPGGGFLGNQWTGEQERVEYVINTFPKNKIVILPQTIYFKNNEDGNIRKEKAIKTFNHHNNLIICAREKKSLQLMRESFENAKIILIPDIVLYLDEYKNEYERNGILLCLRNDPEGKITKQDKEKIREFAQKYDKNTEYTDTVINQEIAPQRRRLVLENKLDEFSKSKLIITDRLHGMVFAAMTRTPCIVIGNYNHKVKGVYEWIKNLKYVEYVDTIDEIENKVKELYDLKVDKYDCIDKNLFIQLKEELK